MFGRSEVFFNMGNILLACFLPTECLFLLCSYQVLARCFELLLVFLWESVKRRPTDLGVVFSSVAPTWSPSWALSRW
jgi:hypothetical protein